MELRKIQIQRGKFNLFSDKKSTVFKVGLFEGDSLVFKPDNDKVKAVLYICSDDMDVSDYDGWEFRLDEMFEGALDYSKTVISSTPNRLNALFFLEMYLKNKEGISQNLNDKLKDESRKKIEKLELDIISLKSKIGTGWVMDSFGDFSFSFLRNERERKEGWMKEELAKIKDVKEGTETYSLHFNKIKGYEDSITFIDSYLKTLEMIDD